MTVLERLYGEAAGLCDRERELLAECVVDSIENTEPLSPEWQAEIERRLAHLDAHPEDSVPIEEVWPKLFGKPWPG
jgi:putative addiction module component (TIGR02574 family)